MSRQAASETIRVFIRFKGKEELNQKEYLGWDFDRSGKELTHPMADGSKGTEGNKITFDGVLVDATQEKMYRQAARDTV